MSARAVLWLRLLNVLGFALTIVLNALANALPINGRTTGELSALYPNLFVPAGLTFSIWGLIYLLLALFVVFQLVALPAATVQRIGLWFLLASAANAAWILAWHFERVTLSLLIMLALLVSLLAVYLRLGIGTGSPGWGVKLAVHLPFSVYLGWITIATVANATALLVHVGWGRFGLSEEFWTVAVLIVATAITVAMLLRRNDLFYALVVLWAFAGIAIKRQAVDPEPRIALLTTLGASGVLLVLLAAFRLRAWLAWLRS
jgi:hypothetical protein